LQRRQQAPVFVFQAWIRHKGHGSDGEASMAEDHDPSAEAGPSPQTARFIERRREMAEASAAVEAAEAAARSQRHHAPDDAAPGYQNPIALIGGVAVLGLLLAGFVLVVNRLHSDSWFNDCPPSAHSNCR
jgi:hypothetical protein